jgi:ppGpp synthetase/RelA/SpoT-type nucleotidyltranferase
LLSNFFVLSHLSFFCGADVPDLTEADTAFIRKHLPLPYNMPDRYEEYILPRIQMHDVLCTVTKASTAKLLEPLIRRHNYRFFCRIDDSHQQKSAASIVEKIRRSQEKKAGPGEPEPIRYDFTNFSEKMTDLARFRIVCNFLHDVELVQNAVEQSQEFRERFNIKKASSITLRPRLRKSGERSIKFTLEYRARPGLFLEIQIMTQLQEAWDKKDHFLVYEKRRINPEKDEENFPDYLDSKMFAMSELLFIADQYFELLRSSEEDPASLEGSHEIEK